jgi:hypothetical protein
MRNPQNIDDFEDFLGQEVNQHRMYPSDAVWRNIHNELHGYKKWPALTIISLFVISALVAGTLLVKPGKQYGTGRHPAVQQPVTEVATSKNQPQQQEDNIQQHFNTDHITQQTIAEVAGGINTQQALPAALPPYQQVPDMGLPENTLDDYNAAVASAAGSESNSAATKTVANASAGGQAYAQAGLNTAFDKKNKLFAGKLGFNWAMAVPYNSQTPNMFYYRKGVWNTVYGSIFYRSAMHLPSSATAGPANILALGTRTVAKQAGLGGLKYAKAERFDV